MITIPVDNGRSTLAAFFNFMSEFSIEFESDMLYGMNKNLSRSLFVHTNKIHDVELRNCHSDECSICLDEFSNVVGVLPCGHAFHKDCILKWVDSNDSCPCCRDDLTAHTTFATQKCSDTINKLIEEDRELSIKRSIIETIQILSVKESTNQVVRKVVTSKMRTTNYFRNNVKDSYRFKRQYRPKTNIFNH
jgi:hypothetical protein